MKRRSSAEVEQFVDGVLRALDAIADREAQDRLDFVLLGGELPPDPVPTPDPDCGDCWGTGIVCSCHGITRASRACGSGRNEKCPCIA